MKKTLDMDKLDLVLLARLNAPTKKAPGRSDVIKAIYPLVEGALMSRAEWAALADERIAALRQSNAIEGDKLRPTDAGRKRLRDRLGLDRPMPWRAVKAELLVARGLELDWNAETRSRMRQADGVRGCLLSKQHHLAVGQAPTLRQAVDALVWRHLGIETDRPLTLAALKAHVLRAVLKVDKTHLKEDHEKLARSAAANAVGISTTQSDKLRTRLVQGWLSGAAATSPPAVAPPQRANQVASEAQASGAASPPPPGDLAEFARRVRRVAATVGGSGRFGDRKVFISAAWRALRQEPGGSEIALDDFKRRLIAANRAGLVRLHRADLVAAMDPSEVRASEAAYLNATFHFIESEQGGMS